jgi:hypothetical protein
LLKAYQIQLQEDLEEEKERQELIECEWDSAIIYLEADMCDDIAEYMIGDEVTVAFEHQDVELLNLYCK